MGETKRQNDSLIFRAIRRKLYFRAKRKDAHLPPKRDFEMFAALVDKIVRYHEIEACQYSGRSAIETISRMGMPEMLSSTSISLAVLFAKGFCNRKQTLLYYEPHILR